jgi:hypothetical protein
MSAADSFIKPNTDMPRPTPAPVRRHRKILLRKIRDFGSGYIRLNDSPLSNRSPFNPCRVNDGALLDLKSRQHASTHARRCLLCACPLYRDELCCPLCGHKRVFFGMS